MKAIFFFESSEVVASEQGGHDQVHGVSSMAKRPTVNETLLFGTSNASSIDGGCGVENQSRRHYTANSFCRALPLRNHGRSTRCIYPGSVRFLATNFCAHSLASDFCPVSFK